ncbi:MAG: DUF4388 domain-containing protein [Anaeromyxobacter sp.]
MYRGTRAATELRRMGAADHLEKPFALDALVAAVGNLLGAPTAPPEGEAPDEVTGSLPLMSDEADALRQAHADRPIVAPAFPPLEEPSTTVLAAREGLAAPLPHAITGRPAEWDVPPPPTGELATTAMPRLLVALHVGQATGALTLTRGPVRKIVVVERGAPVYAASNIGTERLAGLAIRRGVVGADELERLRKAAGPDARTRDLLLQAQKLTPATLNDLLAVQVRAIAWSTFEWREGAVYQFEAGRPPAVRVPLRLEVGQLVLDGMRRTATVERVRAELLPDTHLAPSPDPAVELFALRLRPEEAHLLTLADGTKSAADLARLSELSEREALAFLHACRTLRVLDEVRRVMASSRRVGFM